MHRKEAPYDLFTAFSQFSSDRCLQLRRRLCCHASDPKPGGPAPSMAFPVRIYGPDHHFPDDTWTYCCQLCYLSCILVTLLAKIYLKYRNLSLLQGVLKSLRPAVIAMIAAAGVSILVNAFWGETMASLTTTELLPNISIQAVGIFIGSLILLVRFKINPIHVMLLSGVAEVVLQLIGKIFT